ncbi:MAG TPA: BON domain-containing protein [Acidimicrobiia bacterium]|nr:BON domain-containing protein [Acidimicrobiia bacterium]
MTAKPEYVEHTLISAIAQDRGLGELEVDVAVVGNAIRLTGRIASHEHRQRIVDLVREKYPTYQIEDGMEPVEVPPPPSDEGET